MAHASNGRNTQPDKTYLTSDGKYAGAKYGGRLFKTAQENHIYTKIGGGGFAWAREVYDQAKRDGCTVAVVKRTATGDTYTASFEVIDRYGVPRQPCRMGSTDSAAVSLLAHQWPAIRSGERRRTHCGKQLADVTVRRCGMTGAGFLRELWRGAPWAYLWTPTPDDPEHNGLSLWFRTDGDIPDVPADWRDTYFAVHPCKAPGSQFERTGKDAWRVGAVNAMYADFDAEALC